MKRVKQTNKLSSLDNKKDSGTYTNSGAKSNIFQEANLMNDTLFGLAMENDEFCKIVLSIILGEKIVNVMHKETQSTIQGLPGYKLVRLDVFAVDANGATYNVEIQNSNNDSMPKRSRFYQGIFGCKYLICR